MKEDEGGKDARLESNKGHWQGLQGPLRVWDSLMGVHHEDPFPEFSSSSPLVVADCRMNTESQVLQ